MKKVLLTGATASQSSTSANARNIRFTGLLHSALSKTGAYPEIRRYSIDDKSVEDMSEYSSAVIGLSPFGSMSSNRIYEALYAASIAAEQSKLTVLLDAPDPHLVFKSFDALLKNTSILTRDIYSSRSGYSVVVSDPEVRSKILSVVELIVSGAVKVIVPSVPYAQKSYTRDTYKIPSVEGFSDLLALNFDSYFQDYNKIVLHSEPSFWVSDFPKSKFIQSLSKTLSSPVMKVNQTAYEHSIDTIERLQSSRGYLLSTQSNELPWWSPNIMLALSCGVPVFSDWRHTSELGTEWTHLPASMEHLSVEHRLVLSSRQKESYLEAAPSWGEAVRQASTILYQ